MYTMYIDASNNTPPYTHIDSYMVWRVHPRDYCDEQNQLENLHPHMKIPLNHELGNNGHMILAKCTYLASRPAPIQADFSMCSRQQGTDWALRSNSPIASYMRSPQSRLFVGSMIEPTFQGKLNSGFKTQCMPIEVGHVVATANLSSCKLRDCFHIWGPMQRELPILSGCTNKFFHHLVGSKLSLGTHRFSQILEFLDSQMRSPHALSAPTNSLNMHNFCKHAPTYWH